MLSDWLAFFQLDLLEPDKTNPMKDWIIDNLTKVSHYTKLQESRPILSFSYHYFLPKYCTNNDTKDNQQTEK